MEHQSLSGEKKDRRKRSICLELSFRDPVVLTRQPRNVCSLESLRHSNRPMQGKVPISALSIGADFAAPS